MTAETAKKTTHTPGPWTIERATEGERVYTPRLNIRGANGDYVTDVSINNLKAYGLPAGSNDVREANARLIAQAPRMADLTRSVRTVAAMLMHGTLDAAGVKAHAEALLETSVAILAAIDGSAR